VQDAVVRLIWAQADQARMGELGWTDHALEVYGGVGHTTCPEELRDIIAFLTRVLPAAPAVAAEAASGASAAATGAGATMAASTSAVAARTGCSRHGLVVDVARAAARCRCQPVALSRCAADKPGAATSQLDPK